MLSRILDFVELYRIPYSVNYLIFIFVYLMNMENLHMIIIHYPFFQIFFYGGIIYSLNEWVEIETDKKHPIKKKRPLASGRISTPEYLCFLFVNICISGYYIFFYTYEFLHIYVGFLCINLGYTVLQFKSIPVFGICFVTLTSILRMYMASRITNTELQIHDYLITYTILLYTQATKQHYNTIAFICMFLSLIMVGFYSSGINQILYYTACALNFIPKKYNFFSRFAAKYLYSHNE